ncbi:hypothetical protein HPB51_012402 [Rhipicephalus microplus]|uniref:Uncharacterized protein n=1 Tax=Rhipicephalus microplus TaxID=6941 RepID=A0A9J6E9C6_RHIMP|nr:hypothetical protein HPB51_012402 [Rhipicephalus microplus]
MNSIEQAVQTMSDHFDTILKRLDSQDKQIEQLRKRTEQLERARPDEELHQINSDLNDLEMRSRSRNLEIHGKLFNEHENLLQKINEIARMIQVPEAFAWCKKEQCAPGHGSHSSPRFTPGARVNGTAAGDADSMNETSR